MPCFGGRRKDVLEAGGGGNVLRGGVPSLPEGPAAGGGGPAQGEEDVWRENLS